MAQFTRENAREMAARGNYARWHPQPKPEEPAIPETSPPLIAQSTDIRLSRVRAQLGLLDERIEEELAKPDCDGQRVDRLANASHRLAEQERVLAGRPLPGSLRPPAGRPAREIQARLIPLGPAPTPQADPPKPESGPGSTA